MRKKWDGLCISTDNCTEVLGNLWPPENGRGYICPMSSIKDYMLDCKDYYFHGDFLLKLLRNSILENCIYLYSK